MKIRRLLVITFLFSLLHGSLAASVTVQPGDTLYAIASRHGLTVEELKTANRLASSLIRPDFELQLPANGVECRLLADDSLALLARRHGVTLDRLMAENSLDSQILPAGTVIRVPQPGSGSSYVVRAGDTLYDIALLTGTSVERLIALNRLEGDVIRPGDVLKIAGAPTQQGGPEAVTVEAGDSLWEIARDHGVTVDALAERNGLDPGSMLEVGTGLILPGHDRDIHDLGGTASATVTVRPGDTLSELASRYGTSVAALMAANELRSSGIRAGQRLRIIPGNDLAAATFSTTSGIGTLSWPVRGAVTSPFGYRSLRVNGSNFHNAIDIDGVTGEPVRAAAGGVVAFSGWSGSYGNLVKIQSDGVEYRYAHNSELLVEVGDRVAAGEKVARVGNTGLSFGDHVHFEVRVEGRPVDPLPLLTAH